MSGDSKGDGERAPEPDEPGETGRPSALHRVAGPIAEGTAVEQSLDQFIAQAHSSLVHAEGWSLSEEQAARAREEAARRDEEARRAELAAAEAARAAAEQARAALEEEAARALEELARHSSQKMAALEARLARAEERAASAEQRASGAMVAVSPADPLMRTERMWAPRFRPGLPVVLSAAIALVGLAIVLLLLGRGRLWGEGNPAAPPPAPAKTAAPSAPEPVVRSMLPAEPAVKPLAEEPVRRTRPGRARPRPPTRAAGDGGD